MIPAGGAPPANGNGTGAGTGPPDAFRPTAQPAGPAPGPVPMTYQVGQAQLTDGNLWIVLIVHSQQGVTHCFLDSAAARTVGEELTRLAGAGQLLLGRTVPPPGV